MDFEFLVGDEKPRQLPGSAYYVDGPVFQNYAEGMLKQLARAGVRIVVGHGHGPSTDLFVSKKKDWESEFGLKVLTLQGIVAEKELGFMIDHAGANETSIMLASNPELVSMGNLPNESEGLARRDNGGRPQGSRLARSGAEDDRCQCEGDGTVAPRRTRRIVSERSRSSALSDRRDLLGGCRGGLDHRGRGAVGDEVDGQREPAEERYQDQVGRRVESLAEPEGRE